MFSARCRAWTAHGPIAALAACSLSACSSYTSPTPPGPAISCPAPQTAASVDGGAVVVNFALPTVTGGSAPVVTSCTPASGTAFNVGTTSVTCTARDSRQQTASCSFSVGVTGPPKLTATRFVAFGDSITYGVTAACPTVTAPMTRALERLLLLQDANVAVSYPTKLQGMLAARYTSQSPRVFNEGNPGENVGGPPPNGVTRFPSVLASDAPQIVLLQEGINDIDPGNAATITGVVNGLQTMIRQARASGAQVYLGTLLPERSGTCRGFRAGIIVTANDQIRAMGTAEGATIVDLYAAFNGEASTTLIGPDGLHPTEAGYQQMAQAFFDTIRQKLETASARAVRRFDRAPLYR